MPAFIVAIPDFIRSPSDWPDLQMSQQSPLECDPVSPVTFVSLCENDVPKPRQGRSRVAKRQNASDADPTITAASTINAATASSPRTRIARGS